jgi:hypothetical protein
MPVLAVRQQQFIGGNADLLADLRIFFAVATFQALLGQIRNAH